MFDAHTTQFIRVAPETVLDFVMDIERYAEIDEKIRPLLWIRREGNLTEFAFRPKLGGLIGPTLVSQERLTPGRRVDITLAPAPHNRLIRLITRYEASFECTAVPGGTEVRRSERFQLRRPFRWLVGPFLHRTMPVLVRRELLLAKEKLEETAPAPVERPGQPAGGEAVPPGAAGDPARNGHARHVGRKSGMAIPGPRWPWEQVQLARLLARSPAEGLSLLHERYGSVVGFGFGPFRYVAMLGADANRFILSERLDLFRWREAMAFLIPVDGDTAMVVSDGEDHHRRRQAAQSAFAAKRIHRYLDIMIDEFGRELSNWPVGSRVDALRALRRPIKRVTVRSLFGDHLDKADELGKALDTTIGYVNLPMWRQFKIDLPGTRWRKAVLARQRMDGIVNAEIARRRASGHAPDSPDVLDILLAATDEAGNPALSDVEVRDQVVSLIAASYDTIGSAASWAIHEMLSNAQVREAAAAEIADVLGDERLCMEALGQMRYLDAVVNETLRMWPPTSVSPRKAVAAFEFAGVTVPAGSMVLYSPYVTHRMPEYWPEPDTFRPERWLSGKPEPYTFVPFGGGYRRCIGFIFAIQQLKVLLVELLRSIDLTAEYGSLTPVGIPALHPGEGLPVRVVRRRQRHTESRSLIRD